MAEIKDALLNNKKKVYRRRAKQRLILAGYQVKQGKIKVWEGAKIRKMIAQINRREQPAALSGSELKGSVAYPGLVSGRVKIVLTKDDVAKLQVGDILVSSATNPDLISAMKKAAAFITDQGGVTSMPLLSPAKWERPALLPRK